MNIRESPDVSSAKLGYLDKNNSLTRTGECDNGWSRVNFSGKDAYIYSDYLTTKDPTPKPEPKPSSHTMIGKVVEGTMNSLTITDATTGTEYTFSIEGAEIHAVNGILIGNVVSIDYTGEISGTDTSAVTVTKVTDQDPNTDVIYGVVEAFDSDTVTIKDDGEEKSLTFSLAGAKIECVNGILVDERIEIKFMGEIKDTDTSGVTVVTVGDAPLIYTLR